tara:strand:+ start:237 stop:611 length:375 start_codon:yes stop_codon:yes gene_type:complete
LNNTPNTYVAGMIKEYMPAPFHAMNLVTDEIIHPEHEDSKHRGGLTFTLSLNDTVAVWKVMLNYGDLFDISVSTPEHSYEEYDELNQAVNEVIGTLEDVHVDTLIDIWEELLFDAEQEFLNAEK